MLVVTPLAWRRQRHLKGDYVTVDGLQGTMIGLHSVELNLADTEIEADNYIVCIAKCL